VCSAWQREHAGLLGRDQNRFQQARYPVRNRDLPDSVALDEQSIHLHLIGFKIL
jgi:hypothetical protein